MCTEKILLHGNTKKNEFSLNLCLSYLHSPSFVNKRMNSSIELDRVANLVTTNLPREPVLDPVVRFLHLTTLHDFLLEDAVGVSDSVAPTRVIPNWSVSISVVTVTHMVAKESKQQTERRPRPL